MHSCRVYAINTQDVEIHMQNNTAHSGAPESMLPNRTETINKELFDVTCTDALDRSEIWIGMSKKCFDLCNLVYAMRGDTGITNSLLEAGCAMRDHALKEMEIFDRTVKVFLSDPNPALQTSPEAQPAEEPLIVEQTESQAV